MLGHAYSLKRWTVYMLAINLAATAALAGGTKKVLTRDQVEKKDTWATEDIFPNVKAWEIEYVRLEKEIVTLFNEKMAEFPP